MGLGSRMLPLIDLRMHDGSRHFGSLPDNGDFESLRDVLSQLAGVQVTKFVTDQLTEAWIHFTYQQHLFAANTQLGEWWFFVDDPTCPDEILRGVLAHAGKFLRRQ